MTGNSWHCSQAYLYDSESNTVDIMMNTKVYCSQGKEKV